mgnify:FL=1
MTNPASMTEHIPTQQLILYALGHQDADWEAHLAMCDACRSQAETYRSVLTAARATLAAGAGRVNLVSLDNPLVLENSECEVGDGLHTLRVTLRTGPGVLYGHLTVDDDCVCWRNAPVRLFGPHGLVASSRVDAEREFELPLPTKGQSYSLGLVLTRRETPELQIIGSFEVG